MVWRMCEEGKACTWKSKETGVIWTVSDERQEGREFVRRRLYQVGLACDNSRYEWKIGGSGSTGSCSHVLKWEKVKQWIRKGVVNGCTLNACRWRRGDRVFRGRRWHRRNGLEFLQQATNNVRLTL